MSNEMAKILVIDDDGEYLRMQLRQLRAEGHEVFGAEDGPEGIEKARKFLPDIILLDIVMPGMNGYQVLEKLRSIPSTGDIPVVFLTCKSSMTELREGMERGADDYLAKPVTGEQLRKAIQARLKRRQLHKRGPIWPGDLELEAVTIALGKLGLTNREAEVMYWVMQGKSNTEIGSILNMSPATVRTHLQNFFPKLGVENRHAATILVWKLLTGKKDDVKN
jgi:DNA-binding NarL/FixJ family response regulator